MTNQKCLEFYLPWALTLFNLPKNIDIFICEEHSQHKSWRGCFARSVICPYTLPSIVLYTNNLPSVEDMMETLFHELTHAQQYCESRLIDRINPTQTIWRDVPNQLGMIYSPELVKGQYWSLPWEVEARKVANEKCLEFVKHFKSINPFRKILWWRFKPKNKTTFVIRNGRLVN